MKKTYTTPHLDEATYLVLNRCPLLRIKAHSRVRSEFTFENTAALLKHISAFYCNVGLKIDLNKWLMVRRVLKEHVSFYMDISLPEVDSMMLGTPYWYVAHGAAQKATYGKGSAAHENRRKEGNFFKTREEALASISATN